MNRLGSSLTAIFRWYERELICSNCRSVIAWIRLRSWSLMQIRDRAGHLITPLGGTLAMRVAQTRLVDALAAASPRRSGDDADVLAAQRYIDYLNREAGELQYELTCPNCRVRYQRSLSHLTRDVRRATTGRVILA